MSKKISFLVLSMFAFSLVFVSCKKTKKETSNKAKTEMKADSAKTDTMQPKADSTQAMSDAALTLITENVGEYPRDFKVFGENALNKRIKKLVGDQYEAIVKNFNTQTPVVTDQGVYKFSGCKEHDCPTFKTVVYYDAENDNLNVVVNQKGKTKVYAEKEKIEVTKALQTK